MNINLNFTYFDFFSAIVSFIGSLRNLSKGLVSFNMANTRVTGKGLNRIAEALSQNPDIAHTLQYLNMGDNPNPKGEDIQVSDNL